MTRITKPSQVLRTAAERVQARRKEGRCACCCYAIADVNLGRYINVDVDYEVGRRAREMFASLYETDEGFWFGEKFNKKETEHRVLALLLTADMLESVGE